MIGIPPTYVGVIVSVAGNIVISLALNVQKYAHARLEREAESPRPTSPTNERPPQTGAISLDDSDVQQAQLIPRVEVEPPTPSTDTGRFTDLQLQKKHTVLVPASRVSSRHSYSHSVAQTIREEDNSEDGNEEKGGEKQTYLRSKLWWLGLLLMAVGESANFISYGLAAASVVAPLGTVALIANCFISPLMLGERFGYRDAAGVVLASLGAVTVVLSAKQQDREFDPDALVLALRQPPFIGYCITVVVILAALLVLTHSSRYGEKWVVIDVLICSLFGGFTVLSTKALSSLLSSIYFQAFTLPLSWCLVAVLVGTSLCQIKYLNKALQTFESREVIPTQFVFFSISAIVGSAVLYQEFRDLTASRFANFLFGVATTFVGVFLLTYKQTQEEHDANSQHGSSAIETPGLRRLDSLREEEPLLVPSSQAVPAYTAPTAIRRQTLRKRGSTTSLHRHGLVGGGYLLIGSSPPVSVPLARSFEGGRGRSSSRSSTGNKRNPFVDRSNV